VKRRKILKEKKLLKRTSLIGLGGREDPKKKKVKKRSGTPISRIWRERGGCKKSKGRNGGRVLSSKV